MLDVEPETLKKILENLPVTPEKALECANAFIEEQKRWGIILKENAPQYRYQVYRDNIVKSRHPFIRDAERSLERMSYQSAAIAFLSKYSEAPMMDERKNH